MVTRLILVQKSPGSSPGRPTNLLYSGFFNILGHSFVLVTGSTSGIGLEISKYFASKGYNLILTARRENILNDLKKNLSLNYGILVDCIPADLSLRGSPEKIYKFCESKGYSIEILVNNAGYAIPDPFHLTSIDEEEKFLRVLSTSVIALTKLFLKDMIKNKKGKIMIISSVAAFAPPSTIQFLYGPVKTFMNRFSEGINVSYNQIGITSTAVCPGYTITNFHSSSGIQYEMDRVPKFLKKDSKRIAEIAVNATLNGKRVCIPTKTYKVIVFLLNIIPKSLFSAVNHYFSPGRYDKKF